MTAKVERSTRTRLTGSWTQSERPSDANHRGSTGTPTWIRLPIRAPDEIDADEDGAAVVDGGGGSITLDFDGRSKWMATSVELVADTLAEAAGPV